MYSRFAVATYAALLAALLCTCGPASPTSGSSGPITLTRDSISVTVDPAYGGRLISLKYGGKEVLNTGPDSAGYTMGSVAWTSPQEDWGWPPPAIFDTDTFEVQQVEDDQVVLVSALAESGLRLQKRVVLGKDSEIGLTYWLTNMGAAAVSVAAWEVTRLPYAGRIEFYADSIRTERQTDVVETRDSLRTIYFDDRHAGRAKVFADLDTIPATYYNDGIAFEKHTVITDIRRVAPGQAPLEIYLEPERQFVEFELQGEYRRLEYNETIALRTKWRLR